MNLARKEFLIILSTIIVFGTAYVLYEWLRPMTPGEVVLAYHWAIASRDVGRQEKAAEYIVESARGAYLTWRESLSWVPDSFMVEPSWWDRLWSKGEICSVEVVSEIVNGDRAKVVCSMYSPFCPDFGAESYFAEYRLARKGSVWLMTHGPDPTDIRSYFERRTRRRTRITIIDER